MPLAGARGRQLLEFQDGDTAAGRHQGNFSGDQKFLKIFKLRYTLPTEATDDDGVAQVPHFYGDQHSVNNEDTRIESSRTKAIAKETMQRPFLVHRQHTKAFGA